MNVVDRLRAVERFSFTYSFLKTFAVAISYRARWLRGIKSLPTGFFPAIFFQTL
jgi:hypothetical protein